MKPTQTTGRVEATQIAEAVRTALHRLEGSVTLSGFNLIELCCETYAVDRDREGRGHNGNVIFIERAKKCILQSKN